MHEVLDGLFVWGMVIAAALTLLAHARAAWRYGRLVDGPETRCRACGYAVCPGAGRTCPECGGDLRDVGVIGPTFRRPIYPRGLIVGGGIVLAGAAILASLHLEGHLPQVFSRYHAQTTIPTGIPAAEPGGRDAVIEVSSSGRRTLAHHPPERIDVIWWAYSDGAMRWEVEFYWLARQRNWEMLRRPHGVGTFERFDRAAAERFIEFAGLDPASPEGGALARKTLEQVERFQRLEFPAGDVVGPDGAVVRGLYYVGPPLWLTLAVAAMIWLPCWWLITRLLARHHQRALRRARERERVVLDALGVAP